MDIPKAVGPLQITPNTHTHQILISSLVFLLSQPDGFLRPKREYMFVAPCLIWSVLFLYLISFTTAAPFVYNLFHNQFNVFTIGQARGGLSCHYTVELPNSGQAFCPL